MARFVDSIDFGEYSVELFGGLHGIKLLLSY